LKLARCPHSLIASLATLPWSLALPRARASYPSCVAVYPRDSRSRRVLCRSSHSLHWFARAHEALLLPLQTWPSISPAPTARFTEIAADLKR